MVFQIRLTQRVSNATPLPYTASPLDLLWSDICLFARYSWALPGIFLPLQLRETISLDELYPSLQGAISVGTQVFLTISQLCFLLSVPFAIISMFPALWVMGYITAALVINYAICTVVLNGFRRVLTSQAIISAQKGHERERWHYWLQNNIDLLSYTFGRKITGIHNRTAGLPFDLIECLIQRCFGYATADVRKGYNLIKDALLDPHVEKIVLILHSQGGIEGGMAIDWLLDEFPGDLLHQLEVYTFGNAANHFNNPRCTCQPVSKEQCVPGDQGIARRSIGFIEHYANSGDCISWLGVLRFATIPNQYLGRLFVRPGLGHLMNQHYLNAMFTLGPDMKVLESNPFMDTEVITKGINNFDDNTCTPGSANGDQAEVLSHVPDTRAGAMRHPANPEVRTRRTLRIKDFSRLWQYRNGGSP
ncbi:hypothetical protein N7462_006155 [Penicillium macrosclerotiorum]|uniref:uncharacterized protein n=1 Tax=Penicillium macrosclerotiorum TaxID=303699 RepID=UPI002546DE76|nr:uncharacterized protein N7462_006155 [Penicillium macrosclerotiorum]KAJ5682990.1 hypothetical protein N7462_006155 [Penicillium macrosclerotiorum]